MFTNFILPLIIWVSVVAVVNRVVAQTISDADIEDRLSGIASRYGDEHLNRPGNIGGSLV